MTHLIEVTGRKNQQGNELFKADGFFNELGISFPVNEQYFSINEFIQLIKISGILDLGVEHVLSTIKESTTVPVFDIFMHEVMKYCFSKS